MDITAKITYSIVYNIHLSRLSPYISEILSIIIMDFEVIDVLYFSATG